MENIQVLHAHSAASVRLLQSLAVNTHRIFLIRDGIGNALIDTENFPLAQHNIVFAYPGQLLEVGKATEMFAIAFDERFFYVQTEHKDLLFRSPFFSYVLKEPIHRLSVRQYLQLTTIVTAMYAIYKKQDEWCDRILLSYLNILLLHIKRYSWARNAMVHANDYTTLQLVMRFKQLIRTHCHEQHSVKWYADQLQQTSNYLNLMVKKVTGGTAGDLIADQLVMEAKRQLMHTKLSPKEVAFALGFYDHSYFSKFFKKQTGYSPLEWFNLNK